MLLGGAVNKLFMVGRPRLPADRSLVFVALTVNFLGDERHERVDHLKGLSENLKGNVLRYGIIPAVLDDLKVPVAEIPPEKFVDQAFGF